MHEQEKPYDVEYYKDAPAPAKERPSYEVQKMSWKQVLRTDSFEKATAHKATLTQPAKIRRRPDGFSVMVGMPLKKKPAEDEQVQEEG